MNNIVSERDYVSIFLNYIRHPYGPFCTDFFAHSQTLPGNLEQKYGCDGIIIFVGQHGIKIGMFEAKVIKGHFDSIVGINPNTISRFQRQINKQCTINPAIAVWEMFINKGDTAGRQFDLNGSTCVKLAIARTHVIQGNRWQYGDLNSICQVSYLRNNNSPVNLEQIIFEIMNCNFGKFIPKTIKNIPLYGEGKEQLNIPIIEENATSEDYSNINDFLIKSKLFSYTIVDIRKYKRERRELSISNILL